MIEYRPGNDSLYVNISHGDCSVWTSEVLDDRRSVDRTEDGSIIAVLFSQVSLGIQLAGLPEERAISNALARLRTLLTELEGGFSESRRSGRVG